MCSTLPFDGIFCVGWGSVYIGDRLKKSLQSSWQEKMKAWSRVVLALVSTAGCMEVPLTETEDSARGFGHVDFEVSVRVRRREVK